MTGLRRSSVEEVCFSRILSGSMDSIVANRAQAAAITLELGLDWRR